MIPSTPINVRVGPAAIHAPTCLIKGLTDTPDYGMLEFEVHGRDAFGNSLELLPRRVKFSRVAPLSHALQDAAPCMHLSVCTLIYTWSLGERLQKVNAVDLSRLMAALTESQ